MFVVSEKVIEVCCQVKDKSFLWESFACRTQKALHIIYLYLDLGVDEHEAEQLPRLLCWNPAGGTSPPPHPILDLRTLQVYLPRYVDFSRTSEV
jgi:hypothetical protein